jgi:hypothetical protein
LILKLSKPVFSAMVKRQKTKMVKCSPKNRPRRRRGEVEV